MSIERVTVRERWECRDGEWFYRRWVEGAEPAEWQPSGPPPILIREAGSGLRSFHEFDAEWVEYRQPRTLTERA